VPGLCMPQGDPKSQGRWYVLQKNLETNTITISQEHERLYSTQILTRPFHWMQPFSPTSPAWIRVRHQAPLERLVSLETREDRRVHITLPSPGARALTPGQHVVVYDAAGHVLGGAAIENSIAATARDSSPKARAPAMTMPQLHLDQREVQLPQPLLNLRPAEVYTATQSSFHAASS